MNNQSPWSKPFPSYEDALLSAGSLGYEHEVLVDVVVEKTRVLQASLEGLAPVDLSAVRTIIGVLLARENSRKNGPLTVVDFGGAAGAHYFYSRRLIPAHIKLSWNVVETRQMANACAKVWRDHQELRFFPDIESFSESQEADGSECLLDLLFTSSALQYCANPSLTLKRLVALGPKNIFITRTPFSALDQELITVQKSRLADNGPGPLPYRFKDCEILYPITFVPRSKVDVLITSGNAFYKIDFELIEDAPTLFFQGKAINQYFGLFYTSSSFTNTFGSKS